MSFPVKAWIRFYFKLTLVAGWNGVLRFLYVATGAGAAQVTNTVDLRTLGMAGAGWILAGTVVASIGGAWYKYPIPDPTAPNAGP